MPGNYQMQVTDESGLGCIVSGIVAVVCIILIAAMWQGVHP